MITSCRKIRSISIPNLTNVLLLSSVMLYHGLSSTKPEEGYLVYLSDGDVPFFRVSFSPIFSE